MINIADNIAAYERRLDAACRKAGRERSTVTTVAASKTQSVDAILVAKAAGIDVFGENYVQELLEKVQDERLNGTRWHFIGHLQSNKVKYLAGFVEMIHSVDSVSLAKEVSRQALKANRQIEILFQVNTSGEESKSGVHPDVLIDLVSQCTSFEGIRLRGLMTIPAPSDIDDGARHEFHVLRQLRDAMRLQFSLPDFNQLSMGMSDDFETAIAEGATLIRPGTTLFGERHYSS